MISPVRAAGAAGLVLILLGAGAGAGADAGTAVEVEESVEHYDISGSKAGQLKRAMKRLGPREGGRRYVAYTAWILTWTYTFDERETECRFDSFDVRAAITTTLPRWEPGGDAPVELLERWERFIEALERHENGHARIALEAAASIDAAVSALGPRASCDELEREADATARGKVERYRQRERRYDEETNHGRAQGTRL
jgi:predicted secreted Zn-dependent protease